jgi:hypothetical protein
MVVPSQISYARVAPPDEQEEEDTASEGRREGRHVGGGKRRTPHGGEEGGHHGRGDEVEVAGARRSPTPDLLLGPLVGGGCTRKT